MWVNKQAAAWPSGLSSRRETLGNCVNHTLELSHPGSEGAGPVGHWLRAVAGLGGRRLPELVEHSPPSLHGGPAAQSWGTGCRKEHTHYHTSSHTRNGHGSNSHLRIVAP